MRFLATLIVPVALTLAACGEERTEPETDADTPPPGEDVAPPAPEEARPPADDGELGSDAVMLGEWVSKPMAGAPAALFGPPDSEAAFSVRCEGRELVFVRSVRVDGSDTAEMALMAGGETRRIAARARTDPLPRVTARLPAGDPFADILGAAQQPIAVAIDGGPTFRMPAAGALRQVVTDCGA